MEREVNGQMKITYRIPIRSWANPLDTWIDVFKNIRNGGEDILSVRMLDESTVEIVTYGAP